PAAKVANIPGDVGILVGVAFGVAAVISAGVRIRSVIHVYMIHVCMPVTPAAAIGATAATAAAASRIDILGQVLTGGSQVRLSGAGSCAEIGHLAGPSAATSAQRRLSGPAPTACPRLAQELLIGSGMGIRVCLSELLLELRIAVGDIAAMAGIVLPGLICSRNAKVGMIEFVVVDDVDVDPSRIPIVIGPYGRS